MMISLIIMFDKDPNLSYLQISTSLAKKGKRHMYHMSMDFGKLTLEGLIDTRTLKTAISEHDLFRIKLLASEAKSDYSKLLWAMVI